MSRLIRREISTTFPYGYGSNEDFFLTITDDTAIGSFALDVDHIWFSTTSEYFLSDPGTPSYIWDANPYDWVTFSLAGGKFNFTGFVLMPYAAGNKLYLWATNDPNVTINPSVNYYRRYYASSYITGQTYPNANVQPLHLADTSVASSGAAVGFQTYGNVTIQPTTLGEFGLGLANLNRGLMYFSYQSGSANGNNMNMSMWIKPGTMTVNEEHVLAGYENTYGYGWRLYIVPTGGSNYKFRFKSADDGGTYSSSVFLDSNVLTPIILSISTTVMSNNDGSGNYSTSIGASLYLRTQQILSYTRNTEFPAFQIGLAIGGNLYGTTAGDQGFIGLIDELRFAGNYLYDGTGWTNLAALKDHVYMGEHPETTTVSGYAAYFGTNYLEPSGLGGINIGGAASIPQGRTSYSEIMNGGAKLDGSATVQYILWIPPWMVYNNQMQGGVYTIGYATRDGTNNISMSGGVQTDSQSAPIVIRTLETGGGLAPSGQWLIDDGIVGLVCGGVADVTSILIESVAGGAKLAGMAVNTQSDVFEEDMSGGAIASAESGYGIKYSESMAGGVYATAVTIHTEASHDLMSGTVLVSGEADTPTTHEELLAGGVHCGGWAAVSDEATGLTLGGECEIQKIINRTTRTKVFLAGTALVQQDGVYDEEGSGGIQASGASTNNKTFTFGHSYYSGVLLGGVAIADLYLIQVVCGGSAEVTCVYEYAIEPQEIEIVADGAHVVPPQSHNYAAYCWFWLEPTRLTWRIEHNLPNCDVIRLRGPSVPWWYGPTQINIGPPYTGVNFGSASITVTQYDQIRTGQWYIELVQTAQFGRVRAQLSKTTTKIAGHADMQFDIEVVSAGLLADGESSNLVKRDELNAMSLTLSGVTENLATFNLPTLNGTIIGGAADAQVLYNINPTTGVKLAGQIATQATYDIQPAGSIVASGQAFSEVQIWVGGGMLSGGVGEWVFAPTPILSGGILIIPSHHQQFTDCEDMTGGLKPGGKALPSYLKYFTSNRRGYGRAMTENILTEPTTPAIIRLTPPTSDVSPELDEDRYKYKQTAEWTDVEDRASGVGGLPRIVQNRQGQYLPTKKGWLPNPRSSITTS